MCPYTLKYFMHILDILTQIPKRTTQPRTMGLNMIMDKGMSLSELRDFLEGCSDYVDIIKFGFGTGCFSPQLTDKIKLIHDHNIKAYFGGTLFEAFLVRNQIEDYKKILDHYNIDCVEISDGSITIEHDEKCKYISDFASIVETTFSEVGSKDVNDIIPPYKWIELMAAELNAGSDYVIAEARESGNVGVYRSSGEVRQGLVQEILTKIPSEKIIWEAPQKAQQVYFIKLVGANVNLGNIPPNEVIPLEATRNGLRGDTFSFFLDKK